MGPWEDTGSATARAHRRAGTAGAARQTPRRRGGGRRRQARRDGGHRRQHSKRAGGGRGKRPGGGAADAGGGAANAQAAGAAGRRTQTAAQQTRRRQAGVVCGTGCPGRQGGSRPAEARRRIAGAFGRHEGTGPLPRTRTGDRTQPRVPAGRGPRHRASPACSPKQSTRTTAPAVPDTQEQTTGAGDAGFAPRPKRHRKGPQVQALAAGAISCTGPGCPAPDTGATTRSWPSARPCPRPAATGTTRPQPPGAPACGPRNKVRRTVADRVRPPRHAGDSANT
jgi:hypothetical protein